MALLLEDIFKPIAPRDQPITLVFHFLYYSHLTTRLFTQDICTVRACKVAIGVLLQIPVRTDVCGSFNAGVCRVTETSESSIITLAIVCPSDETLAHDIVELPLPLDAPGEVLNHAIAELLPSSIVMVTVAVPHNDDDRFPSPSAQAVGTALAVTMRAFLDIVKHVAGLQLKEFGKVLVIQPSLGNVSAAVAGKMTESALELGEIVEYHSTTAEELASD